MQSLLRKAAESAGLSPYIPTRRHVNRAVHDPVRVWQSDLVRTPGPRSNVIIDAEYVVFRRFSVDGH